MYFDYSSTPAHPRKIFTLINKFINENVSLLRTTTFFNIPDWYADAESPDFKNEDRLEKELKEGKISLFKNEEAKAEFIIKKGNISAAHNVWDKDALQCYITIDLSDLMSWACRSVLANAKERCPLIKGFSTFLFVVLHEVGHFIVGYSEESNEYTEEEKEQCTQALGWAKNEREFQMFVQRFHCNKPDEKAATDWAIDFLQEPENRKRAKAFEKEFFKAWKNK